MADPRWPRTVGALGAGMALGAATFAASALLLYGGEGFLSSAGFLVAAALACTGAGAWVGAAGDDRPRDRQVLARWTFAIGTLVVASFVASFWLRSAEIQSTPWAGPLALVLLLAGPAYGLGVLLATLERGRRREEGVLAVPALLGTAVGVALAGAWLIPSFPPGLVFLGLALLLTAAGSLAMGFATEGEEGAMAERAVIVTGAGDPGQVGHAVAEAFVRAGARVLVTARSEAIRDTAAALGPDVVGVAADLADPAGPEAVVEAARQRWGRLDVLVNVAGGLHVMKPVESTTPEEWDGEVRSNARTAFLMSRAALPLLRASRGAIINFASPAGLRAAKGMAAYSAAKAGVVALTRSLALEEREHGVRVNAIAPGMVDTAQNRESVDDPDSVAWVTRDQIVDVVLFLASGAGAGINGETVVVKGAGL